MEAHGNGPGCGRGRVAASIFTLGRVFPPPPPPRQGPPGSVESPPGGRSQKSQKPIEGKRSGPFETFETSVHRGFLGERHRLLSRSARRGDPAGGASTRSTRWAPGAVGIGLAESPLAMRSQKSRKPRHAPPDRPTIGVSKGRKGTSRGRGTGLLRRGPRSIGVSGGAHFLQGARWFRMHRPVSCRSPRRSPRTKAGPAQASAAPATIRGSRPAAETADRTGRPGRDPVPCWNFLRMGGTE